MWVYLFSKFLEVELYIKITSYFYFWWKLPNLINNFFNVAKTVFLLLVRNYEETKQPTKQNKKPYYLVIRVDQNSAFLDLAQGFSALALLTF